MLMLIIPHPAQPLLVDLLATRANHPMSSLHSFLLILVQMHCKYKKHQPIFRAFNDVNDVHC